MSHLWRSICSMLPEFLLSYVPRLMPLCIALCKMKFLRVKHLDTIVLEVLKEIFHFLACILQKPVSCKSRCCGFPNGKIRADFGH